MLTAEKLKLQICKKIFVFFSRKKPNQWTRRADFLCTTMLPNFYLFTLQYSSCKHFFSFRVENSVDPDQMALPEAIW